MIEKSATIANRIVGWLWYIYHSQLTYYAISLRCKSLIHLIIALGIAPELQ
jgi:hypothetical protein